MKKGTLLLKNTNMKISMSKVAKCRKQIARLKNIATTWRKVQRDYYPDVPFQVLARFATDKKYIPSSVDLCEALELIHVPSPYVKLPRWYKRIPAALKYFNTKGEQIKKMSDETRKRK